MIGKRKARAVVWLLLATGAACAQEYSFKTFGNAEGLENLAIRNLYQDRLGFLWVSTENGIFRYDGSRFESFGPAKGLPATPGAALGAAPDGTLLVGGSFGLYHLRGQRFEKLAAPFHTVSWSHGIEPDGEGHTYLGTDAGLMELYSEPGQAQFSVRSIPPPSGTSSRQAYGILSEGGTLWYGCGNELCRMDAAGTHVFGRESGLPARPCLTILKDSRGTLWVRLSDEGVFELENGAKRFRRPRAPVRAQGMLGVGAIDGDGRILEPTAVGLLIGDGKSWHKIDQAAGLRGGVYAVYEDRQHSLWIGAVGRGLVQWRGYGEWESQTTSSGLPSDVVYEILPHPNGDIWAGTEGGLIHGARGATGIRWSWAPGLDALQVHAVRDDGSGHLWLGTETKGVGWFDPKSGATRWLGENEGLVGRAAYAVCLDHRQNLWAGTDLGLFVSRPPYRRFTRVREAPAARIWAITESPDGTIWAGGAPGLLSYSNGLWSTLTRGSGLSSQEVLAIGAQKDGTVWVGYRFGGGIDRVHPGAKGPRIEAGVERPETKGLVYFLDFDAAGRLWAGTEHGVDVWDGAHWAHYDMEDGLTWNDCNLHGFAAEADGTVWIGTSGGLARFQPRPRAQQSTPLQVVFTKLLLGNKDVQGEALPKVDLRGNALSVEYAALNAGRANGVLFRYRLLGANDEWIETRQRELQFAELGPGRYQLQLEAQEENGAWTEPGAEFDFVILTPWFRSWWFLALCILAPLALVAWVVRYRTEELKRREREVRRLMVAHDQIRNLAFFDPLTLLPNRRMFLDRLTRTMTQENKTSRLRALLLLDLDNFKTVNEALGHQIGDLMIQEVARRITTVVGNAHTVARLSGDEFVVLLEELDPEPGEAAGQAEAVAASLLTAVGKPYRLDGHDWDSSCTIGIAVFGERAEGTSAILQQADLALAKAKAVGRNTCRFFEPELQAAVNARAALERELRHGIASGQILLYFQPQLENGEVIGAEALSRWQHPERGLLAPAHFISLAEETGLIVPLGDWVLEAACRQIVTWSDHPKTAPFSIAVNISAKQFRHPDFVSRVLSIVERTGADPTRLNLELTESVFVENLDEVIGKMRALKEHGLRFALDDFGTGYASLSYLKRLPLDQLKIDRSFVRDILTDPISAAIAQTVISLGHSLGLAVMAEGVETVEQRDLLARLGCAVYQGFLYSKPVPESEFLAFVRTWNEATLQ